MPMRPPPRPKKQTPSPKGGPKPAPDGSGKEPPKMPRIKQSVPQRSGLGKYAKEVAKRMR